MTTERLACVNPVEYPDTPGILTTLVGDPNTLLGDDSDATYMQTGSVGTSEAQRRFDLTDAVGTVQEVVPIVHIRASLNPQVEGLNESEEVRLLDSSNNLLAYRRSYFTDGLVDDTGEFILLFGHTIADLVAALTAGGAWLQVLDINTAYGNTVRVFECWVEVTTSEAYRRIFPRDDGLAGGAPRNFPESKGIQKSNRTSGYL